ncbi:MAG: Gfo/Idh/MocA family oxidoreductase [Helicobacter sp.]|uniref:Gfo/Idh/MocA family oxidoreductase n=1 Tax=Helicobacter sp. 10-6591 TaxID=2004998 RepID=UPI000DCC604E|nr:Gfo/Idh/MocA family oxidoreductase [Helicobacter sp. 10-6591]MCI6217982.1 Gfo/Idh/MocA family oxidoreductase [Helicobacter sp.]MCI7485724.1 Gfo/Idh/MocA family oxidoreductase [Helicobacter sp.]MDD7567338.1 Gfo/Idh/MocA family oxidoreductase [Helicobacter sp.]MDY5740565.1 Gfo/Idh/MocA family oxidoreductase [Helicobacter sp.]RAX55082.1 hypothetical protein CCY97_04730 [Helicobacter sp. 10-6591]
MSAFALVGAAGFVAPRHLHAIKQTANILVAAIDTSDCVGVLDSYFPEANFFLSLETFGNFLSAYQDNTIVSLEQAPYQSVISQNNFAVLEYLSICTPNFLHKSHIEFALHNKLHAICEKPLVLDIQDALDLLDLEKKSGKNIFTILQLRLHPSIIALKQKVDSMPGHIFDVQLSYITARGEWFLRSWKGDEAKSGGLACNIGIHFFDMLQYVFGEFRENVLHHKTRDSMSGYLECANARVLWFLSINSAHLPESAKQKQARSFRSMRVDSLEIDFSDGFESLHTLSYEHILQNKGFGIESTLPCIDITQQLRYMQPVGLQGEVHPLAYKLKKI